MLQRICVFVLLCVCCHAVESADLQVYNPYPEKLSGSFAIDAGKIKGDINTTRLVVNGSNIKLPFQIVEKDGRKLIISGATIPAYGSIGIDFSEAKEEKSASLIKIKDGEKVLTVETPLYEISLDIKKGYTLSSVKDKKHGIIRVNGSVEIVEDGEQSKYNGQYAKDEKAWSQRNSNVQMKIAYSGDAEAEIALTWPLAEGSFVTDRICFNAFNRLVRHEVEISSKDMILAQGRYVLSFTDFSSKNGEGTVYPQMERCPIRTFPCPGYEFAWNPVKKYGVGLVAPQDNNLLNFAWEMKGAQEGISGDVNTLYLCSKSMRYEKVPGKYKFGFSFMAGGDPSEAELYQYAANSQREFIAASPGELVATELTMNVPALKGRENDIGLNLCPELEKENLQIFAESKEIYSGTASSHIAWKPSCDGLNVMKLKRGGIENIYYVPVSPAITVDDIWPDKIIYKFDQPATASIKVSSHSGKPEKVKLVSSLHCGLNEKVVIDDRIVDLQPGEKKELNLNWKNGRREYGVTLLTEAFADGNLVSCGREYFAVGDSGIKFAQYGVSNPGGINTIGNYRKYIKSLRKNYFGAFEYYAWTPCPYLGLTPEGDSWEPETESQVAYSARVEKKLVIDFVKLAHENGISVFPWMNGEIALGTGLDHPEYYRYGSNGQPLFYNGIIRNGKRYAIAYSSVLYDEKNSYGFGKMMSASIDMFGWDGCRFDWGFTPSVVGDPMRAKESEWFTFEGKSSRELFPDPDSSGTLFLKAFRKGVAEKHPEFVYGTNSHFNEETVKAIPKYTEEISKDSLLWYEYLLDYNQKKFNTWEKWTQNIVADIGRSKGNGAQVIVGWMTPYPAATVSHRAMPFALLFSGAHWAGPGDRGASLGTSWKCWRHALRFSEFYFNRDFVTMDAERVSKEISIENAEKVMWRNWVSERKGKEGRELVVNLLNIDGTKYISERTMPQEPRHNLKVSINLKDGETIKEALLLLSEPEPHVLSLGRQEGSEVVIPELDLAASLVVRISNRK